MTLDETVKAVTSFENLKSSGNDGFPAEFYKTFIDILKPDLLKLYTEISKREEMSAKMHQGFTSCLHKKRRQRI